MSIAELNEEDLAHRVSTALSKNILFDHVDNELDCDDLTVAICKAIEPHLRAVYDKGYRSGVLQEQVIAASNQLKLTEKDAIVRVKLNIIHHFTPQNGEDGRVVACVNAIGPVAETAIQTLKAAGITFAEPTDEKPKENI